MLIDSHAHISTPRFDSDREAILERARAAGLVAIVDVGCDLESSRASLALARREPMVWSAVGVHPHEAKHWTDDSAELLSEMAADSRVVALGETGLDFHYNHSPPDVQRRVFREQLSLAIRLDLPVVLHLREAYDEALGTLDEFADPRLRGVAHCFTGNARQAQEFNRRGFGVSFTGVVTFKRAKEVQEAARVAAPELILVETDCPFMSPVPLRGKRCEPAYVVHTAQAIARLRGETSEELYRRTAENAVRIFALQLEELG